MTSATHSQLFKMAGTADANHRREHGSAGLICVPVAKEQNSHVILGRHTGNDGHLADLRLQNMRQVGYHLSLDGLCNLCLPRLTLTPRPFWMPRDA